MHDCENCNERCPQAEMAHEIALGRMYATQELVRLVKQVESGRLVEVVRCKDCKNWNRHICTFDSPNGYCDAHEEMTNGYDFCSYGEREGGAN